MRQRMPTVTELRQLIDALAGTESAATDQQRIDLLAALEALKGAAAAAQARVTVAFDASQRSEQARLGVPANERGRGVASQVALARRESPAKGARHLGVARALVSEMPHTLQALASGEISEWRATIVVRETAVLRREHRAEVDRRLAGRLGTLGDRGVERESRKLAYRLEPASALRRVRGAQADRRVSIRPAPDTMTYLTGFLPVAQGVAVHTALRKHAEATRARGDARTRGQIMADTLVERVTGQDQADTVPVEVRLVMTDRTLLGRDDTPGRLEGYGAIPAPLARELVIGTGSVATKARAWLRRLFTSPVTGDLVTMESRRRQFSGELREFLIVRDEVCRTPRCDAPIRHVDHVRRASDGGATTAENGQGLCERCNYTKEVPGWESARERAGPRHPVTVTTPTGHRYRSVAPDPPGVRPPPAFPRAAGEGSILEQQTQTMRPSA